MLLPPRPRRFARQVIGTIDPAARLEVDGDIKVGVIRVQESGYLSMGDFTD